MTICLAMTAIGSPVAVAASVPTESVRLAAAGKAVDAVQPDTEVRVRASERGTVPRDQRPATLEILGGYAVRGQTQARVLKKCDSDRCEVDPAIRTAATWTYQAFLVGRGGMELARSRIVKVDWVGPRPSASAP